MQFSKTTIIQYAAEVDGQPTIVQFISVPRGSVPGYTHKVSIMVEGKLVARPDGKGFYEWVAEGFNPCEQLAHYYIEKWLHRATLAQLDQIRLPFKHRKQA